jgi:heme exporter protein C
MRTRSRTIRDAAAVTVLLVGLVLAVTAPPDRFQGDLQRLMYVHVPAAWTGYLAFVVTAVASVQVLRRRDLRRWDTLAEAAAEVGVLFTALTLATGSIWGRPVWGVWWTWDARLVTTALLLLVYLSYLALRRGIDDPQLRARRSAWLGVLAVVQLPVVHMSVVWWRTLHQPPTVLRPEDPSIDHVMLLALLVNVLAFTLVAWALLDRRRRLGALRHDREQPTATTAAGSAVTAPDLRTIDV